MQPDITYKFMETTIPRGAEQKQKKKASIDKSKSMLSSSLLIQPNQETI